MPKAFPFTDFPTLTGDALQAAMREASDLSAAYSNRLSSLTQSMSVAAVLIGVAATVGVANKETTVFLVVPFFLLTIVTYALMVSADSTAIIVLRRQLDYEINEATKANVLRFGDVQGVTRASTRNPSSWFVLLGYALALFASVALAATSTGGQATLDLGGHEFTLLQLSLGIAAIPGIGAVSGTVEALVAEPATKRLIWASRSTEIERSVETAAEESGDGSHADADA